MVPKTLEEWFSVSKHIAHDKTREGARVMQKQLTLGWQAGPGGPALANLTHEMAHMVEISHNRVWWARDWGLRTKQVYLFGQFYNQPESDTGTLREIRTIAIQWHMMRCLGRDAAQTDYEIDEFCRALVYVYDYPVFRSKHGITPDRFEYKQLDAAAVDVIVKKVKRYRERTNIETIWKEWLSKCAVLDEVLA